MMIKYILHPGHIISKTDGEEHYISAVMLCHLYKVSAPECTIVGSTSLVNVRPEILVHLYPRSDGKYSKPGEGK